MKFGLGLIVLSILLILIFVFLFTIIGKRSNNIKEKKINDELTQIYDLKYQLNNLNQEIIIYENKIHKMNLIGDLKKDVKLILFDRENFNINVINENHLYFMESQRVNYNIPKHIYYRLIFMESGFKMYDGNGNILRSNGGAIGYMQMLSSTFNWINNRYDLKLSDVTNPYDNIIAGSFYLHKRKTDIEKIFPNASEEYKWKLTIASYNAGIGDVIKARGIPKIRYHKSSRFAYGDPNTETSYYVNFIMKNFILNENLAQL